MGAVSAATLSRPLAAATATPSSPPTEQAIATLMETKVICRQSGRFLGDGTDYQLNINGHWIVRNRVKEPDRYLAWPTIARTRDGELLVAFSGDRDAHICPWGKTQMIRSRDDGATWSTAETVNNTPLDDRDAGLIQTSKGTLVVSWFTSLAFEWQRYEGSSQRYARVAEKIPAETKKQWLGNWIRRSEDNGKSWGEPIRVTTSGPHGPVSLRDGRLLYLGTGFVDGVLTMPLEESTDDGRTWRILAKLPTPDGATSRCEPHLVELRSGRLIALCRFEPKDHSQAFLLQCESQDRGQSWSAWRTTNIWGYPPHVLELDNGWLLVVYGHRREPYGQRACISRDEGRTWDVANEVILASGPSRDLGYPSSVRLDDGSILTAYYQAEKLGQPPCLMTTRWRLKT
jgi:sialidase-1